MKKILIYGSKSFAQLLSTILYEDLKTSPLAFIDDFSTEKSVNGVQILSLSDAIKQHGSDFEILLGIGYSDLKARYKLIQNLKVSNLNLYTLIHPTAYISSSARLGEGSIIMSQCHVAPKVTIGLGCVLWPMANISHDSSIGDNTFLSPSAVVCGFSDIGHSVFIGSNATITNNISVPSDHFIKAGSLYSGK